MVKFIRGKAGSILLTGGLVVGAILIARHFNLGGTISAGAFGLGQTAGNVITQPIAGLTNTLASGITGIADQAKLLFGSLGSAGADVQQAFTGNRDAIGDFFSGNEMTKNTSALEITPLLSESAIKQRIENTFKASNIQVGQSGQGITTAFGGFASSQAQESALQRAIRESAEKFPQFFK